MLCINQEGCSNGASFRFMGTLEVGTISRESFEEGRLPIIGKEKSGSTLTAKCINAEKITCRKLVLGNKTYDADKIGDQELPSGVKLSRSRDVSYESDLLSDGSGINIITTIKGGTVGKVTQKIGCIDFKRPY